MINEQEKTPEAWDEDVAKDDEEGKGPSGSALSLGGEDSKRSFGKKAATINKFKKVTLLIGQLNRIIAVEEEERHKDISASLKRQMHKTNSKVDVTEI